MAKQQKINKRILRAEYAEIVSEADMPDAETQKRLSPNRITYEIHQYVTEHVAREGFVVPMRKHKSRYIKAVSVYRVFLTKALFKQIHKLPQVQKDIDQVLDILDDCIAVAEATLTPNLSQKEGHRVWNSIKCAYGGKYAPPDKVIFADIRE